MSKSLDQLIDFLLEEIALGGDEGKLELSVCTEELPIACRASTDHELVSITNILTNHYLVM